MGEILIEQDTFFAQSIQNIISENDHLEDRKNSSGLESFYDLGPKRDTLWIVIPMTIIFGLIFLTGLVGNVSTCIVIGRNRAMHTATNYYLFSLAVSDLLLLVTGLPQEIYFLWSRYPYVFGEAFCVLRGLAAEMSANATVLTITAFTIERYVAICHPFLSRTMYKLSRAVKLILVIWIVSLGCAIPLALQVGVITGNHPDRVLCMVNQEIIKHSFEISVALFFAIPMILITVLYSLIGLRLRSSKIMKKVSGASCVGQLPSLPNTPKHSTDSSALATTNTSCRSQGQSSRRVLKMLVAVVVAFFVCWAPFHVQRLVAVHGTIELHKPKEHIWFKVYEIVTYVSGVLYYMSTCINPFLYHIMSNKFRQAFKETFEQCISLQCWCPNRIKRPSLFTIHESYNKSGRQLNSEEETNWVNQDTSSRARKLKRTDTGLTDCSNSSCRFSAPASLRREDSKFLKLYPLSNFNNELTRSDISTTYFNIKSVDEKDTNLISRNRRKDGNLLEQPSFHQKENSDYKYKNTKCNILNNQKLSNLNSDGENEKKICMNDNCGKNCQMSLECNNVKVTLTMKSFTQSNDGWQVFDRLKAPSDGHVDKQNDQRNLSNENQHGTLEVTELTLKQCRISNSTLKMEDSEQSAINDELTSYMQEILERERR